MSRYKTRVVAIAAGKKLAMVIGKLVRVSMQATDKDLLVTTVEGWIAWASFRIKNHVEYFVSILAVVESIHFVGAR